MQDINKIKIPAVTQNAQENNESYDLTDDFLKMTPTEFSEKAGELRKKPLLIISANLSVIEDKEKFISMVRSLKSFWDRSRDGQEKKVSIRITREQMKWEPNALSCGFKIDFVA